MNMAASGNAARIEARLAAALANSFPEQKTQLRSLGREIEMPVLQHDLTPGSVPAILQDLVHCGAKPEVKDGYLGAIISELGTLCVEAGTSTLEYSSVPARDLFALQALFDKALPELAQTLARHNCDAFGLGLNPLVQDPAKLATPKPHYAALRQAVGSVWDLFNITCGDHVHVSVLRDEALSVRNALDLATPLFQALFANSNLRGGRVQPQAMHREFVMRKSHPESTRTGPLLMTLPDFESCVRLRLRERHVLSKQMRDQERAHYTIESGAFADWAAQRSTLSDADLFKAFQFHDHYTWNVVRLRPDYGTVEMRVACAQPFEDGMLYPALVLGLAEMADYVVTEVLTALPKYEDRVRWCDATLCSPALQTARDIDLGVRLLQLAEEGLRIRGQGEDALITPLFERHQRKTNPALRLKDAVNRLGLDAAIRARGLSCAPQKV